MELLSTVVASRRMMLPSTPCVQIDCEITHVLPSSSALEDGLVRKYDDVIIEESNGRHFDRKLTLQWCAFSHIRLSNYHEFPFTLTWK